MDVPIGEFEGLDQFFYVVGPSGPAVAVRQESRRTSDPALFLLRRTVGNYGFALDA
jgi:hypothetical protein